MLDRVAMVIQDKHAQLVVKTALECAFYACTAFPSTSALLRGARRDDTRIVVIEASEPKVDWKALVDWRRNWLNPSVVLLALGAADGAATAAAINAGVDDYLSQPIHGAELLARVKAVQRRRDDSKPASLLLGGCVFDPLSATLRSGEHRVELTAREVSILQLLFEDVGRVVTRQRLASAIWGTDDSWSGHTIEQYVYQIRRKLLRCPGGKLVLRGVYGHGYRLELAV